MENNLNSIEQSTHEGLRKRNNRLTSNNVIQKCHDGIRKVAFKRRSELTIGLRVLLVILYAIFFGYAMYYSVEKNYALIVFTVIFVVIFTGKMVRKFWGTTIENSLSKRYEAIENKAYLTYLKWAVYVTFFVAILIFVIYDSVQQNYMYRLMSLLGIIVFALGGFITSTHRTKIPWGMFVSGLLLQCILGLITLRWPWGNGAFEYLGDQVRIFLQYTDHGSTFVFSENYGYGEQTFLHHNFAMQLIPTVFFFGAFMQVMYYYGVLQAAISGIGWVMELIMGVGPAESFVAAANIFLGPDTSALTIRPLLKKMTYSGYHSVLTSGFATIAGALFGLYAGFGVNTSHLMVASLMSAPAALAVGKMLYPETKLSAKESRKTKIKFLPPEEKSVIEAFSHGASMTKLIVVGVIGNLVAFYALINFANQTMAWFGNLVGLQNLNLLVIFSYLFTPAAFLMGIEPKDCFRVGELLGTKIFLTEIVSYQNLGTLRTNRLNGLEPTISPRSEAITVFALCGWGTFGDIGICLGSIGAMIPKKRKFMLTEVALRAMLAGNLACFITACVAGLLYNDSTSSDVITTAVMSNMTTVMPLMTT